MRVSDHSDHGYRALTPSNSRPHTPPSSSRGNIQSARSPPSKTNHGLSSPPKKPAYPHLQASTNDDWGDENDEEEDEEDEEPQYVYNEGSDEDEFGLPSISSMRREAKRRIPADKFNDPGGGLGSNKNGSLSMLEPERLSGRPRANSSDIALERGPPSYPSAKKSEGKILRPQYKDILRGE